MSLAATLGLAVVVACASPARPGTALDEGPPQEAAAVRAMRARSNAAIAAHDLGAVAGTLLPDVVVTAGNGGAYAGRDSVVAVFARAFADSTFLGYVRRTALVEVSATQPLAAEHGRWTGRWRRADGVQEVRGSYLAMWRRTADGWRIRSELFVTLGCSGSAACGR